MKVAIGSDHAGFEGRQAARKALEEYGCTILDLGTPTKESVDYPDFAHEVARAVETGQADLGVLVCSTGQGMAMAANRHAGIRAALITNDLTARMSRAHNDANIACFGEQVVGAAGIPALLKIFLDTRFEGDRHARRVRKIETK
ncbi:MAG: ribose 5-phosphate isomerase B [Planctomycetota bacterium]